jgi:hypothetical protein
MNTEPVRGNAAPCPLVDRGTLNGGKMTQTAGETAFDFVPARSGFARGSTEFAVGGIEGIEEGPRRSIFARRNRFRPGVLGNLLARAGQLRRVA